MNLALYSMASLGKLLITGRGTACKWIQYPCLTNLFDKVLIAALRVGGK